MEIAALEIVLRTQKAKSQAKQTQAAVRGIGTAAGTAQKKVAASTAAMGGSFAKLKAAIFSTQALLLTLGIGIGLVAAISTLKDFEHTMAGVKAVTGATIEEFLLLNDKARQLGATTIFAATEAAEGMRLLGLAGFEVSEALNAVEGTLNLAAAGSLALGEASQITANIIRSFRLEASKAADVADILAKTATNANTTVGGLGNSFSFVGAVARAANQSVADTAATLGVLTDAGFDASRAGTGLRRVLGEILVKNEDLLARLPDLGLTFEDINLQTNRMTDVFQRLAPLASDAAFALETFGQRGGPAFLAVVGQADRLDLLADKVNNAGDAAKDIADILTDTLFGSLKLMKSALEEATLRLGDAGFTGALRGVADTVTGVVTIFNGMGETLGDQQARFEVLAEKVRIFGVFLGGLALVAAAKGFLALAVGIKAVTLALLANPFVLWAAAIAGVIALLYSFRNEVIQLGDQTVTFGALTSEIFGMLWGTVKEVVLAFASLTNAMFGAGEQAEVSFGEVASAAIMTFVDLLDKALKGIRGLAIILGDLPNMMKNWGQMSDEAFAKLQDLDKTEPIGERAAENYAKGFAKGIDAKTMAAFKVAIKDVLKQAEGLERRVVSISGLKMGVEQAKELKLLQIEAFEASKAVTELAQAVQAAGGAESLSAEQMEVFTSKIKMAKTGLQDAGRNLLNFQERLQQGLTPASSDATDVIEKLADQLKVLQIFGDEAQFVMQALTEANLENADASDKNRIKVEGLAKAVLEATKVQDAYKFAIDNSQRPLADLGERMEHLQLLLDQEKISRGEYNTAIGLTKLEMQELNEQFRQQEIMAAAADMSSFKQGMVAASTQMGITRENMQALGATAATEMGTALTDAFKNPAEAGDIFLNALARIGDAILELAMQELLLKPLLNTLTGINQKTDAAGGGIGSLLGGGGGGGGILGMIGGIASAFGSKGGYADSLPTGIVPAETFAHARRFKMGGAVDNIPAMLNRNEAVVPLGGGRAIPVNMKGGGGPQVVMNISTPAADSFRQNQSMILSRAAAQMGRAAQRNN